MVKVNAQDFFSPGKTLVANLRNDLENLLETYSADKRKAANITDLIVAKYSEKHRAYHNLSHVNALLQRAEKFKDKLDDYESVRLAVWFHDVVYEPKKQTNETESARLAVESLTVLNFPKTVIEKVEKMIRATQKHDASALDEDGRLFLDLDLSILGAKPEIYKKYARAIRQEYSFAFEDLYRYKRRIVLESFLKNKFIYYTAVMRKLLEQPARYNIANEIKELS